MGTNKPASSVKPPDKYRLRVPLSYGGQRYPAGSERSDIPDVSLGWLTEQGLVERVEK